MRPWMAVAAPICCAAALRLAGVTRGIVDTTQIVVALALAALLVRFVAEALRPAGGASAQMPAVPPAEVPGDARGDTRGDTRR